MAEQYAGDKAGMPGLEKRWQEDDTDFKVLESPCASCTFFKEGETEECQVYTPLPWDIFTGKLECPDYRRKSEKGVLEYKAVGNKKEILEYTFLPEEASRQVHNHEALAIWGYDGKTPVCCGVFTQKDLGNQTAVVLQYLCTSEAYRSQGMTRKLMEYAAELFERQEIAGILAFSQGEESSPEGKKMQDAFLQALGFEEYIRQYQVIEYPYSALDSDKLQPFLKKRDGHLCSLDIATRSRLLQINRKMERRLLYYFSDDTVSPDSLAYVENGAVLGAVILDERENYQLCIRYLYVHPDATDKTILLKLLGAVLAKQKERKEEGNILIFAPEERISRLMEYFFGEPSKRYDRTMYLMQ